MFKKNEPAGCEYIYLLNTSELTSLNKTAPPLLSINELHVVSLEDVA